MRAARLLVVVALLLSPACGKRGDPQPPLAKTPQAVRDLAVSQRGTDLVIRFLAPRTTTGGLRLDVHEVEILTASGEGEFLKTALVEPHRAAPGESVVMTRPLPAPGTRLRVAARAKAGGDRSALTGVTTFLAQPPPPAPTALTARLAPEGVMLAWTGTIPSPPPPPPPPSPAPSPAGSPSPAPADAPRPAALSAGPAPFPSPSPIPKAALAAAASTPAPAATPKPANPGFRVYRRDPIASFDAPMNAAPVTGNAFEDRTAASGPRWCYVVRLAVSADPLVESAPSNEVCVDVKDVAPPAAPLGVATLVAADAVELSWSASPELDLAGYRVYRAPEGGAPAKVADLASGQTTWRDPTPGRGGAHLYTVTAVDQAGNESAPSRPAEGHLP